ncbi:MAG: hypothetical protein OIN66_11675 [Candidatus Methanoperedens sp.]|nr:hypothetical protein [Candidatus Methanoperedens sp.]
MVLDDRQITRNKGSITMKGKNPNPPTELTQEDITQIEKLIKELKEANELYRQRIIDNEKNIAALENVLLIDDLRSKINKLLTSKE